MAKPAANSIEGKSKPFLDRIENLFRDLESERGTYMAKCKEVRSDIAEVYTEAKDAGVPVKSLRSLVRYRELERKQQAIGDGLDIDESAAYSQLVDALGDLGRAAAKAAGYDAEGDGDQDVRPRHMQQADKEREDEERLKSVGRGKDAIDSLAQKH